MEITATGKIMETLKSELNYLSSEYGVKKIGIFGSVVNGVLNEESDVDIVVELTDYDAFKFLSLTEYFEKRLGRKVDVLTPEGVRSIRSENIKREIKESIVYV